MTRLWPEGIPIAVVCNGQGRPDRFTWRGRAHAVTLVALAWRVDLEWWRARTWRAYYKLATDTGLLVVVYRDLVSGDWYLQRLYD